MAEITDTHITIGIHTSDYNRFKVANEIQDASNPSGVARELVRVIHQASRDPECQGTDWIRADAAVAAVIYKLASLMHKDESAAYRECADRSEAP